MPRRGGLTGKISKLFAVTARVLASRATAPVLAFTRATLTPSATVLVVSWLFATSIGLSTACKPVQAVDSTLTPEMVELIYKLSNQPELMNIEYLRYIIGDPQNERSQRNLKEKNYHWYSGPKRQLVYTLHQDGPRTGVVTHSSFMINLPASGMTRKDMEKVFGPEHQHVFDQRSFANDIYSMGPGTYVAFTQPHDSFRVKEIHIGYNGGPLPQPSRQDIAYVYGLKQSKALHAHAQKNWHDSLPWMAYEARMRPADPYAHMRLAQTFRGLAMVNESIAEYCAAMKLSNGDPNVMEPCRLALVEMKVIPASSASQPQGKSYLVKQGSSNAPPGPQM